LRSTLDGRPSAPNLSIFQLFHFFILLHVPPFPLSIPSHCSRRPRGRSPEARHDQVPPSTDEPRGFPAFSTLSY
jgi:hypothetical protein